MMGSNRPQPAPHGFVEALITLTDDQGVLASMRAAALRWDNRFKSWPAPCRADRAPAASRQKRPGAPAARHHGRRDRGHGAKRWASAGRLATWRCPPGGAGLHLECHLGSKSLHQECGSVGKMTRRIMKRRDQRPGGPVFGRCPIVGPTSHSRHK